jgi:hypothetical protein
MTNIHYNALYRQNAFHKSNQNKDPMIARYYSAQFIDKMRFMNGRNNRAKTSLNIFMRQTD